MAESTNVFCMRGWLLKWTNYVKGYKPRWFVLSKGTLLYYRNELELAHTCRGSVSLIGALIYTQDACSFVISNGPSQAYYLKASGEVERQRWVTALEIAKTKAIIASELYDELGLSEQKGYESEILMINNVLGNRIENLQTSYSLIVKHGNVVKKSLSDFDNTKSADEVFSEIKTINQQATVFRLTSSNMITSCTEYMEIMKINFQRLHQIMEEEYKQRKRLENIVEHLLMQYEILEKAASHKRLLSADEINTLKTLTTEIAGSPSDENDNVFNVLDLEEKDESIVDMFSTNDPNKNGLPSQPTVTTESDYEEQKATTSTRGSTPFKFESPSFEHSSIRKPITRRDRIPDKPNYSLSLWSVMKNCIGKDLSKIPMPVNFSEPLSMLQRIAEDFAYSSVLDHAATCKDVCEQLAYVAAFTVSNYSTTAIRSAKPFNPLLGETFELDRTDDFGWRLISEQVSHHPPMAAQYCESKGWTFWQEFSMSSKFRGKYLQIIPLGIAHLVIHSTGSHYTWRKVTTTVNNIIVGTLWVDQYGEMDIINHNDGSRCHLNYLPFNYFKSENQRRVKGCVFDKDGHEKWVIEGKWDKEVQIAPILGVKGSKDNPVYTTDSYITAWQSVDPPAGSEKYYNFSLFACQLNEMEDGIAPTDSRLRPDQRLMEEGKWDEANVLKVALEDKQRTARKAREEAEAKQVNLSKKQDNVTGTKPKDEKSQDSITNSNIEAEVSEESLYTPYEPVWFKKEVDSITGNIIHVYKGEYWEAKKKQDWSNCHNIYL